MCCDPAREGVYLGVNAVDLRIESKPSLDRAWIFHSHDRALKHIRWIREVFGEIPDVVKLDQ